MAGTDDPSDYSALRIPSEPTNWFGGSSNISSNRVSLLESNDVSVSNAANSDGISGLEDLGESSSCVVRALLILHAFCF